MIDPLLFDLGFVGLPSILKGRPSDTPVFGEGHSYDHASSGIPGYPDDGQIRQCRRREREKARRAAESRWHRCS